MVQVITLVVMIALVAVDQIIKLLVVKYLEPIGSMPLIKGFVSFTYSENTGAAFGSFSKYTYLLSIVTFIVIAVGLYYIFSKKIKFGIEYCSIVAVLSGGIGNLIDRVIRGYVVDFIEPLFIDFAIFNFADMLITCGAVVLICYLIVDIIKDYKKEKTTKNE